MYVKDLLKNINNAVVNGNVLVEVEGLTISDSEVKPGYVYFCINGTNVDGHEFAVEAVSRGAVAVVCERALDVNAAVIIVPSVRKAMSIMAADFYGRPADKLRLVGITGTNGKTSTCHIVRNILRFAGHKVGVIGTLGISYGSVIMAPELTTPDPIFLHKIFCDMVVAGVEIVVMEVSAHSMELFKTEGLRFEVGVFTNFTQDHLDFFGTMQKYSAAKQRFLT
ncbi:MAG: UDP-N-acetylmuramoyl-L-alanyl-D-glutamate--2,6-diaminopimelate ligase, partial [Clostridia bacterium]|nr:UDP-N-acetylmuramoyl-L-alanyl-D-glutamate--2,6-diaminopimelate ligase [Clostridia bacterium]